MSTVHTVWELPEIPLTPVDLVGRRAAATGSTRVALAATDENYNGHHVSVTFKDKAVAGPTWNAEYWWAGRHVLGRGSLAVCLAAAKREYNRGARGTVVRLILADEAPEPLNDQVALAKKYGFVPASQRKPGSNPSYWTGTHEAVWDALGWERNGFGGMVAFALEYKGDAKGWPKARDAWIEARKEGI